MTDLNGSERTVHQRDGLQWFRKNGASLVNTTTAKVGYKQQMKLSLLTSQPQMPPINVF
jgi:hypothetical protein